MRSIIGKTGRKLFMLFCWLFTLLVIAAFTDMVAGTFVAKGVEGMTEKTANADASAASISMLFIVVAIIFGLVQKSIAKAGKKMNEWVKAIVAIVLLVAMFCCRYGTSNLCYKVSMDLHHHGLSFPCISYANVVINAA